MILLWTTLEPVNSVYRDQRSTNSTCKAEFENLKRNGSRAETGHDKPHPDCFWYERLLLICPSAYKTLELELALNVFRQHYFQMTSKLHLTNKKVGPNSATGKAVGWGSFVKGTKSAERMPPKYKVLYIETPLLEIIRDISLSIKINSKIPISAGLKPNKTYYINGMF